MALTMEEVVGVAWEAAASAVGAAEKEVATVGSVQKFKKEAW